MRLRPIHFVCTVLALGAHAAPGVALDPIAEFLDFANAGASDEAVRARLVAGGAPLVAGERVLFVAEGGAEAPRIVGDFNDWGEREPERGAMRRLGDGRFHVLETTLRSDARIEYRVAIGDDERTDPFNASTAPAFVGENSELRMPGWRPHPCAEPAAGLAGRLVPVDFGSRVFGDRRRVTVYLPPGYDESERRFPSAWIGDGGLYVSELGVAAQVDALVAARRVEPLIAIFVPPVVRRIEYDREPRYRELIAEELLPALERAFRIERRADRRSILGSSRGGQAALDVALAHPELFGRVGVMAPALGPRPLAGLFDGRPPVRGRFAVVRALYDGRWGTDAAALRAELERRGGDVAYREIPEGHSRETWRQRFLELLETLWAP